MSKVVIQGNASGTGDFTIAAPNSNTDRTLTLPDEAGEVLVTDGTTLVVDQTNDRVGIGTSSPSTLLHLKSAGPAILTLEADSDNVTEADNARIELSQDGGTVTGNMGYATSTNSISIWNNYAFGDVLFGTNNTERMRIDSDGIVTRPNQPVFSGYQQGSNTGSLGGSTDSLVVCNGSYINNGSHYNTSTGIFTCPVAGMYRVNFYTMSITATTDGVFYATRVRLYKNGSGLGNYGYNYGDGYRHVSGNWAVNCSANDTLGVMSNDSLGGYNWLVIELIG